MKKEDLLWMVLASALSVPLALEVFWRVVVPKLDVELRGRLRLLADSLTRRDLWDTTGCWAFVVGGAFGHVQHPGHVTAKAKDERPDPIKTRLGALWAFSQ